MVHARLSLLAVCMWLGCGSGPRSNPEAAPQDTRTGEAAQSDTKRPTAGSKATSAGAGAPAPMQPEPRDRDAGSEPSADACPPPKAGFTTRAQTVCGAALGRPQSFPQPLRAELVRDGFGFLEGPVWLESEGALLFSDMDFAAPGDDVGPPARIRRLRPPATFDVLVESAGSNGLALDRDGSILACSHDVQSLSRFDPKSGARTSLSLTFMGKRFNSPNDVVVRGDGNIYFSDPDWQIGKRRSETGKTSVYRVAPGGAVTLVSDRLDRPNGVTLSLDERTLYVGSAGDDVMSYPVDAQGAVGSGTTFVSPGASDGMTIDCAGNLYVTAGGAVQVFAPDGKTLARVEVEGDPSNVAFGGPRRSTLYITAGPRLYSLALGQPGLPY